jgi:macrolide transport system ATP-binding/permease protein
MGRLMQDIRYALRQLRRSPGFAVTVILTLALGIGANTAFFTLVHAVLLKNLPVADPKMLVHVGDNSNDCCNLSLASAGPGYSIFSTDGYTYLREHAPEFENLAAMSAGPAAFSVRRVDNNGESHFALGEFVSGNYFQTFGVPALAGRTFTAKDDVEGAAPVAMMSYATWQHDFNGDPSVVGSSFVLNTHPITIIGITPPSFYGDRMNEMPPSFFLPIAQEPELGLYQVRNKKSVGWLYLIGRVKPGTNVAALQSKLSGALQQSLGQLPEFSTDYGKQILAKSHVTLVGGGMGIAAMQHDAATVLYLLMGIAGLVLLIACANIANLVLVRGISRKQETSIRIALGAARSTIMRQRITESLVLALLGGFAGLALAYEGTKLLIALMMPNSPDVPIHAAPSLPVMAFTFGISMLTGLIFGTMPAWMTSREQPANAMRSSTRTIHDGTSLLQRGLVVTQAALSLVLLVGAGLLSKSLNNMEHQNFGLETKARFMVNVNPLNAGYKPEQLGPFYQRLSNAFHALPGVEHVGFALYSPLEGNKWSWYVYVEGQKPAAQGQQISVAFDRASPEYFQSVGQHLLRGREFTENDTATSPGVAIVNQSFVKAFFKNGEDPIGQHLGASAKSSGDFEIVGIVNDSKYWKDQTTAQPMYFTPLMQQSKSDPPAGMDSSLYIATVVLQMKSTPPNIQDQIRRTFAGVDPNLTVGQLQTFTEQINSNFNAERMISRLTLLFGLLALVLASVGLYGVTSYSVAQRTSEIGIRMALGAVRTNVVSMVLRSAMIQTGIGLTIGVPVAILAAQLAKAQLFEVQIWDVTTMVAAVVILALAALIAGVIPARRAASIEPMSALRAE